MVSAKCIEDLDETPLTIGKPQGALICIVNIDRNVRLHEATPGMVHDVYYEYHVPFPCSHLSALSEMQEWNLQQYTLLWKWSLSTVTWKWGYSPDILLQEIHTFFITKACTIVVPLCCASRNICHQLYSMWMVAYCREKILHINLGLKKRSSINTKCSKRKEIK